MKSIRRIQGSKFIYHWVQLLYHLSVKIHIPFMKHILLHVTLLFALNSMGQTDIFISWEAKAPLKWEDFEGKAKTNYGYHALTRGVMNYDFENLSNTSFKLILKVKFDKKLSWVLKGKETDELLRHEQVHFDIYELYARKFMKKLSLSKFNNIQTFSDKVTALFKNNFAELSKFQKLYDKETNHSKDEQMQKKWEQKMKRKLEEHLDYSTREHTFSF